MKIGVLLPSSHFESDEAACIRLKAEKRDEEIIRCFLSVLHLFFEVSIHTRMLVFAIRNDCGSFCSFRTLYPEPRWERGTSSVF